VHINDSANTKMTTGLTVNQGAADDEIVALKSSDVGHTSTNTEADTYGAMKKYAAANGGLAIEGYTETEAGICLVGVADTPNTDKADTAVGLVTVLGAKGGGALADPLAGANVFVIRTYYQDLPSQATAIFDRDSNLILLNSGSLICQDEASDDKTWLIGAQPINMGFTDTSFDTKAECNAYGVRFSDDAGVLFPSVVVGTISGTWTHSAGNGWQPASSADAEGPAILVPLMRPGNWELSFTVNYAPTSTAHQFALYFGYLTNSNHYGALGVIHDSNAGASELSCLLYTNDGDDTLTAQYTGTALAGTGLRTYKFRCQNGAIQVYDEQDDAWHSFNGRQSAGVGYTAAYAFLNVIRPGTGATLSRVYLTNLTLTYLL
jgi:hypothetical protein